MFATFHAENVIDSLTHTHKHIHFNKSVYYTIVDPISLITYPPPSIHISNSDSITNDFKFNNRNSLVFFFKGITSIKKTSNAKQKGIARTTNNNAQRSCRKKGVGVVVLNDEKQTKTS